MKKPVHPDNRGWKKPTEYCLKHETYDIARDDYRVNLYPLLKKWEEIKEEHRAFGYKIVGEPYLDRGVLHYDYEWKNANYVAQLESYNGEVEKFLKDQIAFAEFEANFEENRKKSERDRLDAKIVRTERRLANLKAVARGAPLPYPTETDDSLYQV